MTYQGPERRNTHDCIQTEEIGRIKEFMMNNRTLRKSLTGMIAALIIQVVTFGFLWGQLTTVVSKNTDYIWNDLRPAVRENTRALDRMLAKFEDVKVITVERTK